MIFFVILGDISSQGNYIYLQACPIIILLKSHTCMFFAKIYGEFNRNIMNVQT